MKCDMCAGAGATRFGLVYRVPGRGRTTSRGAGSIRMCGDCWRLVSHGHRYAKRPGFCRHGHEMTEANTYTHSDGGPRCRECTNKSRRLYVERKRLSRRLLTKRPALKVAA